MPAQIMGSRGRVVWDRWVMPSIVGAPQGRFSANFATFAAKCATVAAPRGDRPWNRGPFPKHSMLDQFRPRHS